MILGNLRINRSKTIVVILVIFIIVLVSLLGYLLLPKGVFTGIKGFFISKKEYTVLLDEFILNLDTENNQKSYLKIELAMMYKDKKQTKTVVASTNKIRDIMLNELRGRTPEEMLDIKSTDEIKEKMKSSINKSLLADIIEEIYITNLVVQ